MASATLFGSPWSVTRSLTSRQLTLPSDVLYFPEHPRFNGNGYRQLEPCRCGARAIRDRLSSKSQPIACALFHRAVCTLRRISIWSGSRLSRRKL